MIDRHLAHVWNPCSQMKDAETFKLLEVVGASGSYIQLKNEQKILDAISSWWCKSLGHQHPDLKDALLKQIEKFEHVILANTTNETIVTLSEKLAGLSPTLNKVFYASEGSSAVEIAMKMSLHARQIQGDKNRKLFLALENGYHGETVGALSVSDLGLYRDPYQAILFESKFISALPYVNSQEEGLWENCELHWQRIEQQLMPFSKTATAIIFEPIVQGAGGMKVYSQDFLKRLKRWAQHYNVHLIADEIMTGMGRAGKMLACQHAAIEPDFICLSKGLTAGWLPLSAVLTTQAIYDLFYDDYATGKSFLHSHTFSGNALAASIAIEVFNVLERENICERAMQLGDVMRKCMLEIADQTQKLTNVRGIGGVIAADLICHEPGRRLGFEVAQRAIQLGALLRPLGNTIYWFPPLNIHFEDVMKLRDVTLAAIMQV